jgi:hypothetical protein
MTSRVESSRVGTGLVKFSEISHAPGTSRMGDYGRMGEAECTKFFLGQLGGQLRVWRRRIGRQKSGRESEGKELVEGVAAQVSCA